MRTVLAVICVLGCGGNGSDNHVDANRGPDAKQFRDAPPTNNATVMISGQASERSISGQTLLPGVTITAYRNADENNPIATTSTDAMGNFTFTIETMGESIDGFLKASKTGFLDTYLYPPYPIAMDFNMATVVMITADSRDSLSTIAQGNQQPGNALVGLVVTNGMTP